MIISASDSQPRFRFSLRGLMAVIFGTAVGLTAARQSWVSWHEALLTSVVCWFALGLVSQILDLRAVLSRETGIDGDLRFGGRLAIAWRMTAILLLVGYCTLEALRRQGLLTLAAQESSVFDVGNQLRELLFNLAIIVIVSSAPQGKLHRHEDRIADRLIQPAAWLAAIAVCLLVWSSWPLIVFLVHVAISGIESSFPTRFADPDIVPNLLARTKRFVIHVYLAALLIPVNMWLTRQLAEKWTQRTRRSTILACLSASLGVTLGYLAWFRKVGVGQFSPHFAYHSSAAPLHLWLSAALLIMFASAVASYRLVSSRSETAGIPQLDWRRHPRRYLHERRLTLLALALALGGNIFEILQIGWGRTWQDTAERLLNWPENFMVLAAFWLAACQLFRGSRNSSKSAADGQVAVSPRQFGAVWLATSLTLLTAIPLIAWFCFSLWLLLGYRFEWL